MKTGLTLFLFFSTLLAVSCTNKAPGSGAEPGASHPATNRDEIVLSAAEQKTGMIQTEAAALSNEPGMLRVTGRITLADDRTWHVGVRADGLVMMVFAGLGDYVHKGQILARYHADEVREARAQYRTAISDLTRLEAAAGQAQRNYDRAQTLLSLKAGSMQQLEQARQDQVAAQASLKNGQIVVDRIRDQLEDDLRVPADPAPGTPEEIADDVPILAPADGYIIEKVVTPGKTVQPSADTFVIGDLSQVWMLASVRQENLGQLRVGQSATVTLQGMAGQSFPGKITNLGQELDPATRVMQVRIVLNNPGNRLRPEMLATAEIPVGGRKPAWLVPSDAVQQMDGQDVVFVRTSTEHFTVRPVRTGETAGGKTPVLDGLKAGEQVVVQGSFILKSQLLKSTMESE
jgi:multidrug efflux pump subunit AcrA (membrane-fusion protein)